VSRFRRDRDTGEEARATTLELFFDLVFVFAVTQVSHLLLEDQSWRGWARMLLVLAVVWWAWNYTTWVTNELDPDSTIVRLLVLALMFASLLMAVAIGVACQVASRVQFITATHPIDPEPRRTGWESAKPIVLGDNVWLSSGVIVCPGVTIGDHTVVGAGAVVTRDLPAGVVATGVPARVLREIGEHDRIEVPS